MTATTESLISTRPYRVVAPVASRPRAASIAVVAATPIKVSESHSTVIEAELCKQSQKHFAMAGTDINVWPLGPQERLSG